MVPSNPYLYVDIPEEQATDQNLDQPLREAIAVESYIDIGNLFSLRFASTPSFGSYLGEMDPDSDYHPQKYFHFPYIRNCVLSVPETKNNIQDPRFLINYYENRQFVLPEFALLDDQIEIFDESPATPFVKVTWGDSFVIFQSLCTEVFEDTIKFSGLIRFPQFLFIDHPLSKEVADFMINLSDSKEGAGKLTFGCGNSLQLNQALFLSAFRVFVTCPRPGSEQLKPSIRFDRGGRSFSKPLFICVPEEVRLM